MAPPALQAGGQWKVRRRAEHVSQKGDSEFTWIFGASPAFIDDKGRWVSLNFINPKEQAYDQGLEAAKRAWSSVSLGSSSGHSLVSDHPFRCTDLSVHNEQFGYDLINNLLLS